MLQANSQELAAENVYLVGEVTAKLQIVQKTRNEAEKLKKMLSASQVYAPSLFLHVSTCIQL